MIIECPFYIINNSKKDIKYNVVDPSEGFKSDLLFFPCLSSIFFAYGTPVGALPVYKELTNNVERRIKKVYRNSMILLFFIYILIGLVGYMSVPLTTPNLIIDREKYFNNDIILSIGKIFFLLALTLAYAANYICARLSLINVIFKNPEDFNNKHNVIITAIFVLLTTTISSAYSQATDYMSILGGFLAVIIANLLPTYLWIKTNDYHKYHWRNVVAVIMTSIIVLVGWFSGIITAKNMISPRTN